MNEKKNPASFNNGTAPRGCERGEELVAYIYGETSPVEAKAFRQHLTGCSVCREELAAFGGVREAVGVWRAEVFGSIPSLNIDESFAPMTDAATGARALSARRRSAVAALREFFSLSPLWMQVGTVTAALVVLALAALTFARTEVKWDAGGFAFRTGLRERVIEKQVPATVQSGYTREQVDAMIEQGVEQRLATEQAAWKTESDRRVSVVEAELARQKSANRGGATLASKQSTRPSTPGRAGRNQLADAGDPFSMREERVPRLTDLLGAVNAPQ